MIPRIYELIIIIKIEIALLSFINEIATAGSTKNDKSRPQIQIKASTPIIKMSTKSAVVFISH